MNQKFCKVCLEYFEENELINDVCKDCRSDISILPDTMPKQQKFDLVQYMKQNHIYNRYKKLSSKDKDRLAKCEKCEWLRYIDYLMCKVHCGNPMCERE